MFLMNPFWSAEQKSAATALIRRFAERAREGKIAPAPNGRIFIASGGSGGKIRFVAHTPQTLEASARALVATLFRGEKNAPLNCFACLPPWHVSGLMPFVRACVSGGKFFVARAGNFHAASALVDFRRDDENGFWMNSLVPTQLKRILDLRGGADWLRGFDFILLGGAVVSPELVVRALAENLKIGIGYGMTETASLVALWRPDGSGVAADFRPAGTALAHAKIFVRREDSRIEISAESLGETLADDGALLPNLGGKFLTGDEGRFDASGRLVVLGRADRYINSGGEKIDPAAVENALRRAGADAALVVGEPDAEWGECVVALVITTNVAPEKILSRAREFLPPAAVPKRLVRVAALPFDRKGKLDREALRDALSGGSEPRSRG